MDIKRQFVVEIYGLKEGNFEYDFDIDNAFFQSFKESLIEIGSLKCHLILTKSERLITVDININGIVKLICDRSLDTFDHRVNVAEKILFKYGEEEEELENNIYSITSSTQRLDLGQVIFDLISVFIPIRKLHPRYSEEDMDSDDGYYYSSTEIVESNDQSSKSEEDSVDPRWDALKQLKDKIK